ncbi:hypothetical protein L6R52_24520, partial [Myxococcota bacterium]|nr:hypothetical protein [Myxococcota bacterium]
MTLALALSIAALVTSQPSPDLATADGARAASQADADRTLVSRTFALEPLRPLPFALIAPAGRAAAVDLGSVGPRLASVYARSTDLEPAPLPAEPLARCRGRLACLVEVARA